MRISELRAPGRRTVVCAAVAIAVLVAGCGSDGSESSTAGAGGGAKKQKEKPTKPKAEVTEAQIKQYAAASPERTTLEWWRDAQVNDPEHARELYLEPPSLADIAGQFNYVAGRLDGSVEIVSAQAEEDGSTVVAARWSRPSGGSREVTIRLSSDGSSWKLTEIPFVNELVAQLQAAEEGE